MWCTVQTLRDFLPHAKNATPAPHYLLWSPWPSLVAASYWLRRVLGHRFSCCPCYCCDDFYALMFYEPPNSESMPLAKYWYRGLKKHIYIYTYIYIHIYIYIALCSIIHKRPYISSRKESTL